MGYKVLVGIVLAVGALIALFLLTANTEEQSEEEVLMSCNPDVFETPQYLEWECDGDVCTNGLLSCVR